MVPIEGVPFASLESLRPSIWQIQAPVGGENWSRDHHETWKFAYRHAKKIHWFQKCYSFRSATKNDEVIAENRFRTVASPDACERLAVL